MKRFVCFVSFVVVTGPACAGFETRLQDLSIAYHAPYTPMARSYRCVNLEFEMCSLIESAAAIATAEGYTWYRDDKAGELWFAPGQARTTLWGGDPPELTIYMTPGLWPTGVHKLDRYEMGDSALVELNVRRGGVALRDSDIVDLLIDEFERGLKEK